MENSEWLKGLVVGSEVYITIYGHSMWSRPISSIKKITGETPKQWKIGEAKARKTDGYVIGGGSIREVTKNEREHERRKIAMLQYSGLASRIDNTINDVLSMDTNKIADIGKELNKVVKLIMEEHGKTLLNR